MPAFLVYVMDEEEVPRPLLYAYCTNVVTALAVQYRAAISQLRSFLYRYKC